ncbi:MAG: type II toxin-antitoxin system VapB family antitoxin [Verrucomicrobia bacterium]|nr:type II toxin-antitoxin system VapB family antitoxin [Verrucomicrobiota bacterium]MDA1087414.1 type II toxin-antitoxin system VapB family antitoxin [Verrucomicrobiota bacterium]
MRTTIEIPDSLLAKAKKAAIERKTTLRALVEAGLRKLLSAHDECGGHRITGPMVQVSKSCPVLQLGPADFSAVDAEADADNT